MKRKRGFAIVAALTIAVIDLLPLLLLLKQAFTPERESFAWPPTWWPQTPTLENFGHLMRTAELGDGLWRSLLVAVLTVGLTFLLTLPAAWLSARQPRVDRGLDAVMIVTRLFPSLALAVPLAALFVDAGLYNHPAGLGLWLAHTLLGIPIAFLVLRTGFRAVPRDLEEAAWLDGAGAFTTLWRIGVPLIRPSLAAAAMLVFLASWDEFAYAILLQVTNRSLPPLLYYFMAFGYPGLASALAALMLLPALCIIVALEPALRSGILAGSSR